MLKLNSIPSSVFKSFNDESQVKTNSEVITRKSIVETGRLVACEYFGNKLKGYQSKINSVMGSDVSLADLDKQHRDAKLMFCATKANEFAGKEAPKSIDEVRKNASYFKDDVFLKVMAAIDKDVIEPLAFSILDDVGMGLMQWTPAELGKSTEIEIKSNDVFLFEDGAWGSSRSTSKNYLYSHSVYLTPKSYTCNATIKWYQDIVNGEAGRYYAAIMGGMWNKIYAILMGNLKKAISNGYIPTALSADTYTTQNWLKLTDLVAAANGVQISDLVAIGTRASLNNVLPVDGTGGAIVGMQYGLGEKWFGDGYLPRAGEVDLMPVSPVIVPGTQNSTLATIDTEDNIYILAKGAYAPMRGVVAEGSPITLTATPSQTADFTIDINVTALFEIAPLFASKVAVMESVYPADQSI